MIPIGLRVAVVMGTMALAALATTQGATAATTASAFDDAPAAATADAAPSPGVASPGKCILLVEKSSTGQAPADARSAGTDSTPTPPQGSQGEAAA